MARKKTKKTEVAQQETVNSPVMKYKVLYKTGDLTLEKHFATSEEADAEVDKINASGALTFIKKDEI